MSCCSEPTYASSTHSDECLNCGYYFNYITGDEGYNTVPSPVEAGEFDEDTAG